MGYLVAMETYGTLFLRYLKVHSIGRINVSILRSIGTKLINLDNMQKSCLFDVT